MLNVERIFSGWGLEEIFDDGQWCPVCGGRRFGLVEGRRPVCERCDATFELRPTAGDPGVVIDCWPDPCGRFLVRDGPTTTAPQCCQVLKDCEAGLADRERWLITRADGLVRIRHSIGAETCVFSPEDVARILAHRAWRDMAEDQRATRSAWEFRTACAERHAATLRASGYATGRYWRTDAEQVFDDDGWVIHRCIPRVGAQAIVLPERQRRCAERHA